VETAIRAAVAFQCVIYLEPDLRRLDTAPTGESASPNAG
jgi:hypothetical protein